MAAKLSCTLPSCRSIHTWLRCASVRPAQCASILAAIAASNKPSASASQTLTSVRSRPPVGINLPTGDKVSRYSTMTRESYKASPVSISRHGTLPKGLNSTMVESGAHTSSSSNWYSSFFSAITMRTLRTYGLVTAPSSFIKSLVCCSSVILSLQIVRSFACDAGPKIQQ